MHPILPVDDDSDEFGDVDDSDLITAESETRKRLAVSSASRETPAAKRLKLTEDASYSIPREILSRCWGFPDFRLKQAAAISRLVSGKGAAVIFPTGGGKSLVYQVPALSFDDYDDYCGRTRGGGVTLVVSPLIALMKVRNNCNT